MRKTNPKLTNHRAPAHREKVKKRIANTKKGDPIYDSWQQNIRLKWNKPSPTLCAGPRPNFHFGHPTDPRGLTVRERARLQSFPDSFTFYGSITKQRQQTGNAVPPLLSKAIALEVKEKLEKI